MKQFSLFEKQDSRDVPDSQIRACKRFNLSVTRKYALTGEGNIDAHIIFVTLTPKEQEDDRNKKMFIDSSEQIFNKLF